MTLIIGFKFENKYGIVGDSKWSHLNTCNDKKVTTPKVEYYAETGTILGFAGSLHKIIRFKTIVKDRIRDRDFDLMEVYDDFGSEGKVHSRSISTMLAQTDLEGNIIFRACDSNCPYEPAFLEEHYIAAIGSGSDLFYGAWFALENMSGKPESIEEVIGRIANTLEIINPIINLVEPPYYGWFRTENEISPIEIYCGEEEQEEEDDDSEDEEV